MTIVFSCKAWQLWLGLFLLVSSLLLGWGCSPLSRIDTAQLGALSEGQVEALDRAGSGVVACLIVGGPPAVGAGVVVVYPKSAQGSFTFAADCRPAGTVTLSGGGGS